MKPDDSLNFIRRILKTWQQDLEDQTKIENLRNAFMEAKTTKEVNEICLSNIQFIDRIGLWPFANRAKKRIIKLNKVKKELTDIIYLN